MYVFPNFAELGEEEMSWADSEAVVIRASRTHAAAEPGVRNLGDFMWGPPGAVFRLRWSPERETAKLCRGSVRARCRPGVDADG